MFTADVGWVGLLVALATVAARLYLRETDMEPENKYEEHLELLKDMIWESHDTYLDYLLFHKCRAGKFAAAMVWIVGWEREDFIKAAILEDRSRLDG